MNTIWKIYFIFYLFFLYLPCVWSFYHIISLSRFKRILLCHEIQITLMSHILSWTTNKFSAKYACKNSCFKSEKKFILLSEKFGILLFKKVSILVRTLIMKKILGQVSAYNF